MTHSFFKTYQNSSRDHISAPEATALLLEEAAKSIKEARAAIEAGHTEKRFKESERATIILGNLEKTLIRTDAEQTQTADDLKAYYDDMISLIVRMNRKNDPKSAESISESLQRMASEFRNIASLHEKQLREKSQGTDSLKVRA